MILSILIVSLMTVSLVACGDINEVADGIADARETVEEISGNTAEDVAEELSDEEAILNFFNSIYSGYKEYIDGGFDAENNVFVSPATDIPYLNPKFILCDANGDNYDDLIIWGDTGIRDKQISEVYFYVEKGDAFFSNNFDGYVDALSEGCVLVEYTDREVDSSIYYDNYTVYNVEPFEPTVVLTHHNEDADGTITDEYLAGEKEITEEEYNEQFVKYEAAIIPIAGSYLDMTEENIADAFNML